MTRIANNSLGATPDGRRVERYVLCNAHGLRAELMSYGAALMALHTPDRAGRVANVVLGFDTLAPYLAGTPYFGATVGRCANRIAGARFDLDGRTYKLAANEGRHHLHGGRTGFDKVVWRARAVEARNAAGVVFSYVSADGEEGYPGELNVETEYLLSDDDRLSIEFRASTTAPTHVNLTHHSYFNLSGAALRDITGHSLWIGAERFTPVNSELIPTGELRGVADTPFDFRTARPIGAHIDADDDQLRIAGGYDHNFILDAPRTDVLRHTATLCDPESGRAMALWTSAPGLQVYSGNYLDGSLIGAHGPFTRRSGLCLEPQHFPNSPNEPAFPSTVLRPGENYRARMELRFYRTA